MANLKSHILRKVFPCPSNNQGHPTTGPPNDCGYILDLLDIQGLRYYFPENFRCNLTYYESENFSDSSLHHIFESENFRFSFCKKIA